MFFSFCCRFLLPSAWFGATTAMMETPRYDLLYATIDAGLEKTTPPGGADDARYSSYRPTHTRPERETVRQPRTSHVQDLTLNALPHHSAPIRCSSCVSRQSEWLSCTTDPAVCVCVRVCVFFGVCVWWWIQPLFCRLKRTEQRFPPVLFLYRYLLTKNSFLISCSFITSNPSSPTSTRCMRSISDRTKPVGLIATWQRYIISPV